MTLRDARIGGIYKIEALDLDRSVLQRMGALGLTRGTDIKLINRSREGSVILMVRGSRLAVGRKIAGSIRINSLF